MKYTTLIIFQMEHFPQNVYSKEFYFVKFSTYFFLCFNPIFFFNFTVFALLSEI